MEPDHWEQPKISMHPWYGNSAYGKGSPLFHGNAAWEHQMATILIIDDSWLTRRGLNTILTGTGHEVVEAENGIDGITAIENKKIDCVLLDLLMPEMDGFEVLRILKSKNNTIPVVVLTADIQNTVKEKCLALGAFDFINKPPSQDDILEILARAIQTG